MCARTASISTCVHGKLRCSFTCESVDAFMAAFMPHMAELQGDIPNYTDVEAVIQIGELNILMEGERRRNSDPGPDLRSIPPPRGGNFNGMV